MQKNSWLKVWRKETVNKHHQRRQNSLKQLVAGWMILQTVLTVAPAWGKGENKELTYGELLEEIDKGQVKRVEIDPTLQRAAVTLKNQGEKDQPQTVELFEQNPELIKKLNEKKVEYEIEQTADRSALIGIMSNLFIVFLLLGLVIIILRRSANASGQAMNFGKSRARFQMEAKTNIQFNDVAGIDEAKEELQEVVTFLKQPEKFTAIGAKIPKGVLLIGPPGTGKTLLAKAISGEAGVPFFSISGSEFVEMFVGVGASRVRDLFKKAKESAPCLIFIDEIDAVGRQRGVGYGGGNDEREQTLNQLLTEMDGFEGNTGIIVIAATNRPDVLDMALLRPGRFDRQIMVDYPDIKGRLGILEIHARNKKIDPDVSLEAVARRTPGFTGADLANVLNEAAIFTARRRKEAITMTEIGDAIDRVVAGMEGTPLVDSKSKRIIAYHELGHALVGTFCPGHEPLEKVTIIPRGRAGGLTWFTPDEEQGLKTRSLLLAQISSTLGGRVAEECIFGDAEVTTGASHDIEQATSLAKQMVTRFGMSDIGPFALEDEKDNSFFGEWPGRRSEHSEEVTARIDAQIRGIITHCYKVAQKIIQENRVVMDRLVDILVEQETIEGDDFRKLVAELTEKSDKPLATSY